MQKKNSFSKFDDGINSLFINYNINYLSNIIEDKEKSLMLDILSGVNVDSWRLRYREIRTFEKSNFSGQETTIERSIHAFKDLVSLSSTLSLGDTLVPSSILEGFPFRGIMLKTNEQIDYDTLNYLPLKIMGTAKSNAEVKIYQSGILIHTQFVPPGNFTIKDISPIDPSGTITMILKESDGSEKYTEIPYLSTLNINKIGIFKYLITFGKYRSNYIDSSEKNKFILGTFSYGLSKNITFYVGGNESKHYSNISTGIGISMDNLGALSLDHNYSKYTPNNLNYKGNMSKLKYAKTWTDKELNLTLLLKYHHNKKYLNFANSIINSLYNEDTLNDNQSNISIESTLSKSINNVDNLYVTFSSDLGKVQNSSLTIGYNTYINDISLNIYGELNNNIYYGNDKKISLELSIPIYSNNSSFNIGYSYDYSSLGEPSNLISINGNLNDFDNVYFNASAKYGKNNNQFDADVNYQNNFNDINIRYSSSNNYKQFRGDISGSLIAYNKGVVLGKYFNETAMIVDTAGISNIEIENQYGVKTNNVGIAILSDLTPYRENKIKIEDSSLPQKVEFYPDEFYFYPSYGAILHSSFSRKVSVR